MPLLVKQLNECQLPEDRNRVMDIIEQIDKNLLEESTRNTQCQLIKECDGMKLLTKVGKKLAEGLSLKLTHTGSNQNNNHLITFFFL